MSTYVVTSPAVRVAPSRAGAVQAVLPRHRMTWATACAYAVVYGVAGAFLLGPAGVMLSNQMSVGAARASQFAMVLVSAAVMGFGSVALSFFLGRAVDAEAAHGRRSQTFADAAFGAGALLFAAGAAALFVGIATVANGAYVPGIGQAAGLGVLVPAVVAGLTARNLGPQLAATRQSLAAVTLGALSVVGLAVYLCAGMLESGFTVVMTGGL